MAFKADNQHHVFVWDIHNVLLQFNKKQFLSKLAHYDHKWEFFSAILAPRTLYHLIMRGLSEKPVWEDLVEDLAERFPSLEKHTKLMFDFANSMSIKEDTFNLIKQLKANGFNRHFILSNCGPRSFAQLAQEYQEYFNLFEGVQTATPPEYLKKRDVRVFQQFLENFGLTADQIIFIDDREHNNKNAESLGMYAIRFTSTANLEQSLQKIEAIKS